MANLWDMPCHVIVLTILCDILGIVACIGLTICAMLDCEVDNSKGGWLAAASFGFLAVYVPTLVSYCMGNNQLEDTSVSSLFNGLACLYVQFLYSGAGPFSTGAEPNIGWKKALDVASIIFAVLSYAVQALPPWACNGGKDAGLLGE